MSKRHILRAHSPRKSGTDDTVLLIGSFGYRFANRLRLEGEFGYDTHDLNSPVRGRACRASVRRLINVDYDAQLSDKWDFTFGAGAGIGRADVLARDTTVPAVFYADGTRQGFMWQGMAGFNYSVSDNLDLSLDWRYRSLSVNKDYPVVLGGLPGPREEV